MVHACERPLGGDAKLVPWSPTPAVFGSSSASCDQSYNRTYPADAESAWTAVVLMTTSFGQFSRFVAMGNYQTWSENLLINKNIVPVIFYPSTEQWFKYHEWQSKGLGAHRCPAPNADVPGTRCAKWHNHRGQILVTCPVDMEVPLAYNNNLNAARKTKLPTFCGRGLFSGEYVVATKWFTYPMFLEPILSYFDFWAKFDVDVCFRRGVQVADVIGPLVHQRANFFHSKLTVDNAVCELTLGDMMQLYHHTFSCAGSTRGEPPWAAWDEPYDHPPVPYANFVGGWLGFWQSRRVLHFADKWWRWKGGWMHRWTDQQYWMPALWMMGANSSVLDLSHLRYGLFRHSKDYYACGGGDSAEANATRDVFAALARTVTASDEEHRI